MRGLSLVAASGGHSSSRCAGPLTITASLVAEHRLQTRRLSSCGSWAQPLCGMWDLPRPGLEPVSPALAGRFPTTAPPGKPQVFYFYNPNVSSVVFEASHFLFFHKTCRIGLETWSATLTYHPVKTVLSVTFWISLIMFWVDRTCKSRVSQPPT